MTIKESRRSIKQWEREFKHFNQPINGKVEDGYNYYSQDIEIDAIAFSNLMLKTYFKEQLIILGPIKKPVAIRAKKSLISSNLLQLMNFEIIL